MAKEYIDREAFIADKRAQYCDNCDRRKGMKNGKMRFVYDIGDAPCRACGVDDMMGDIEDYPAADVVEVRHAHWIRREGFDYENNVILGACSKCDWGVKDFTNYCPSCGAKMDESENDEE